MSQVAVLVVLLTSILLLPSAAASLATCTVQTKGDLLSQAGKCSGPSVCEEIHKGILKSSHDMQLSSETAKDSFAPLLSSNKREIHQVGDAKIRDECTQATLSWVTGAHSTNLEMCTDEVQHEPSHNRTDERESSHCIGGESDKEVMMTGENSSIKSSLKVIAEKRCTDKRISNLFQAEHEQCLVMLSNGEAHEHVKSQSHGHGDDIIVHGFLADDRGTQNEGYQTYSLSEDTIVEDESQHGTQEDDELLKQAIRQAMQYSFN